MPIPTNPLAADIIPGYETDWQIVADPDHEVVGLHTDTEKILLKPDEALALAYALVAAGTIVNNHTTRVGCP